MMIRETGWGNDPLKTLIIKQQTYWMLDAN